MRATLTAISIVALLQGAGPVAQRPSAGPPLIYSARPEDSWNRLFALLFTRTIRARFTSEFADRGPFDPASNPVNAFFDQPPLHTSTRIFEGHEDGDRAIDALYPAFLNQIGPREALVEPLHGRLVGALNAALEDRTVRSALARALMQADLWSAYDPLAGIEGSRDYPATRAAAAELTAPLARLIAHLRLTSSELAALPNNYEDARRTLPLPDLFHAEGGWIEIVRNPDRVHDGHEQLRRAARVFVRPSAPFNDAAAFVRALMSGGQRGPISATALVVQTLAIDASGHVVPTPLVSDVQIRSFTRDANGTLSAAMAEYELSRKHILSAPAAGGFLEFGDRSEAYLAASGNDYGFATPAMNDPRAEATIGTLHTRCGACHGRDGSFMISFAVMGASGTPAPRALRQPNDERARYVAAKKEARDDFKHLLVLSGLR